MSAPPAIPLPAWIQRARSSVSNEKYVECAVTVALELTNSLCIVSGRDEGAHRCNNGFMSSSAFFSSLSSWDESMNFLPSPEDNVLSNGNCNDAFPSSLLLVQIQDIVPENVMVSIANDSGTPCADNLAATEVTFRIADGAKPRGVFETAQLSQRSVCFRLGNILFELFSQGNPLWMVDVDSIADSNNEDSISDLCMFVGMGDLSLTESNASSTPASKKRATLPTCTSTKHTKAKVFLQERGLPLSVCRLVSDLLEAEEGNQYISRTALISLEDAQFDLMQMRACPPRFLHDQTCPETTSERTSLFRQFDGDLYGRQKELKTLMNAADRVSVHVSTDGGLKILEMTDFLVEAVFLSGHSGSGKSSIIKHLVSFCAANDWFVIMCKIDRQVAPVLSLLQSFDNFFGTFLPILGDRGYYREPSVQDAFDQISRSIISSVDGESFRQLCELMPNLNKLFPMAAEYAHRRPAKNGDIVNGPLALTNNNQTNTGSGVGSGRNRLNNLFHIIFKAVCKGGHPVVMTLDDLQWSDTLTLEIIRDLIQSSGYSSDFSIEGENPQSGLLLLGSYRDNEVDEDCSLMDLIKILEQSTGNVKVNQIFIGELLEPEINKMLSLKLCLPMRYTQELAQLVYQKTTGNPMYVIEFLRSIIQGNMLSFSVKSRQWTWDDTSIEIQMISKGVVELLTRKLRRLPSDLVEALKVASCIGQLNLSTIELLDLGQFVPNLLEALESAVKEGILERAGPVFAFSHDMLQESTYSLIPVDERRALHKNIGMSLVQKLDVTDDAELCALAVDQINSCKGSHGVLDPAERALFARLNLAAGKHSIAASSFAQARGYFEAGISLLQSNSWEKQYSLSLELHEMSVVVSFMDGKVETLANRLDVILSNVNSFDDSLKARAIRAKFWESQAQYSNAANEIFDILSKLGEDFPRDACLSDVTSEIKETELLLKDVNIETIINLPPMTEAKLNAMKFMGILCTLSLFLSPTILPLLSCRMIKLTLEFGFCEDTISALACVSHAFVHYSDDIQLASRMGRIAESLMCRSHNEHSHRARLMVMTICVRCFIEPFQATVDHFLNGYNSGKIVGDVDNSLSCGAFYCIGYVFAYPDLASLQRHIVTFLHQLARHKRVGMLHSIMTFFNVVAALKGCEDCCTIDAIVDKKTNKELYQIAEQTQSSYLMHHVIVASMYVHCYFREHLAVVQLAETYAMHTRIQTRPKRILDFYLCFFEGISALCLARDTKHEKWKSIGQKSVQTMVQLVGYSSWNFENKLCLLQAELNYLHGRHEMAELLYKAAIISAHDHRFFHEEALACELYGVYLLENKKVGKGLEQFEMAINKYRQWGAAKKADEGKNFMELVKQPVYWMKHG